MSEWSGVKIMASRPLQRTTWTWLRKALRDVGYPVAGWSFGGQQDSRFEITVRAAGRDVREAIRQVWDHERPEYATLSISIQYG